jgi:Na+-transporting NADH:ubiquinone oxidoreductase subunit B
VVKQAAGGASEALTSVYSHADLFFGNIPGSAGEMSKLAVLLGAFWLIFTGVGSWRVMLGGVLGLLGFGLPDQDADRHRNRPDLARAL